MASRPGRISAGPSECRKRSSATRPPLSTRPTQGPRLYFQRVPERKTAKNRVHLDVRVAGREVEGEERKRLVSEKVEQLVEAGASIAWVNDIVRDDSIVHARPRGQRVLRDLRPRDLTGCIYPRIPEGKCGSESIGIGVTHRRPRARIALRIDVRRPQGCADREELSSGS